MNFYCFRIESQLLEITAKSIIQRFHQVVAKLKWISRRVRTKFGESFDYFKNATNSFLSSSEFGSRPAVEIDGIKFDVILTAGEPLFKIQRCSILKVSPRTL